MLARPLRPIRRSAARPRSSASVTVTSPRALHRFGLLAWLTVRVCISDKIPRFGAALAFYTTVAVSPLLVLAVAVAQFFFKDDSARRRILGEIDQLVGSSATQALNSVQSPPAGGHSATFAAWIGSVTLIIGGLGVFVHLQDALNSIWRAPAHTNETWPQMIKRRLFSFGTVLATGFVMLVSLTLSAVISWFGENASRWARLPAAAWEIANFTFSFAVILLLFAVLFKLLPDVKIRWRDVWTGAAVTALLFVAGKTLLGIYLAHSSVTSAFGAAGSVIALLLWCYYAGQILFIGAEFTRVHARTHGGRNPLPPESPLP